MLRLLDDEDSVEVSDDDVEETFNEWAKPMQLKDAVIVSDGLKYHLDNKIPLGECVRSDMALKSIFIC